MNQKEVAQKYKLSESDISNILGDKKSVGTMTLTKAVKVAEMLNWPIEKLARASTKAIRTQFFNLYKKE